MYNYATIWLGMHQIAYGSQFPLDNSASALTSTWISKKEGRGMDRLEKKSGKED